MNKLTFTELHSKILAHNLKGAITQQYEDKNPLYCVIVFSSKNWPNKNYSQADRSYIFRSDNKYFLSEMAGNSLYADCLNGVDPGVRLDWYLHDWEIDYCYIQED